MDNIHKMLLDSMEAGPKCCENHSDVRISVNRSSLDDPEGTYHNYLDRFIFTFGFVICLIGIVGNGIVIWLLGFCIKRNPFTIYILNLAIADFGVITATAPFCILDLIKQVPYLFGVIVGNLGPMTYAVGQLLLTVISVDRCVVVLFPIWHRCHRPTHWSTIVCAFIWIYCFLLYGVCITLILLKLDHDYVLLPQAIVNAVFCLPLVTISTVTLLFQICCKLRRRRGKIWLVLSLTLLFFLTFAFPLNVIFLYDFLSSSIYFHLYKYGTLCAILNSSINPVIYFSVGRKKKSPTRETMKMILQRVFKEEEEHPEGFENNRPNLVMMPS